MKRNDITRVKVREMETNKILIERVILFFCVYIYQRSFKLFS